MPTNIPTISRHISVGRFIANLPINAHHTSSVRPSSSPRYFCRRVPSRSSWHTPCTTSRTQPTRKGDDTHELEDHVQRQVVELPVPVGWSDEVGGDTMIEATCRAPTPPNPAPDPPFPIPPTPEPSPRPEPRPMPPV